MFNNKKITLCLSVSMRTSREKVRLLNEAGVQSVSYSHVRSLTGLHTVGCFKGRQARHLPRAHLFKGPLQGVSHVN